MNSENNLTTSSIYSESGEIECSYKMIDDLLHSIKNDTHYLTTLHTSSQYRTNVVLDNEVIEEQ